MMDEAIDYIRRFLPVDEQPEAVVLANAVQDSIQIMEMHTGRSIEELGAVNDSVMVTVSALITCAALAPAIGHKDIRLRAAIELLEQFRTANGGITH